MIFSQAMNVRVEDFLRSLQFVGYLYFIGDHSWTFNNPFNFAPPISFIIKYAASANLDFEHDKPSLFYDRNELPTDVKSLLPCESLVEPHNE